MADPQAEDGAKKSAKKFGYLLVHVPGWPSQDPGRRMVFREYPTLVKAQRKAARFNRRHPDFVWEGAEMTQAEALRVKSKPFRVPGLGVLVKPTAKGGQVRRES